jgi:hypothetical protein
MWISLDGIAQNYPIRGEIRNEAGQTVSYASIVLDQTNIGTSANDKGVFHLQVSQRQSTLIVRALGYQTQQHPFEWPKDSVLQIVLKEEVLTLPEIQIGAYEDPAYYKIRQAIKKRKEHLQASQSYQATVYIKGVQRFIQAPKSIFGVDLQELYQEIGLDSTRKGIFYLSESESRIWSDPPDYFREEMISSRMAGNPRGFSFNRASDLKVNFYENSAEVVDGLGQRPFISPIADNALAYYRYKLIGETQEEGYTISKIEVIPRRLGDPVYQGYIYLIDDVWRLKGLYLKLTKAYGAQLIDSLSVTQQFQPLSSNQWMIAHSRFDFGAKILGFEIVGEFAAVYRNFQGESGLSKKEYVEALKIPLEANQKDEQYWRSKRPVALTLEESDSYHIKDSLSFRRDTPAYKDSVDRARNAFRLGNILNGYRYQNSHTKTVWEIGGILQSLGYNTVEGVSLRLPIRFEIRKDTLRNKVQSWELTSRYGVANERFTTRLKAQLPHREGLWQISLGSDIRDISPTNTLNPFVNTLYTLIDGHNYLKLYEHRSGYLSYQNRLPFNLRYQISAEWARRIPLQNTQEYSFLPAKDRSFTSNNPFMPDVNAELFPRHEALTWGLQLAYNFSNRYETLPWGKRYLPSKHPDLRLSYRMGIPGWAGSDVNFQWMQVELLQHERPLGIWGKVSYHLRAGQFLKNTASFYPDWQHFNGRETLIDQVERMQFLLLPYYTSYSQAQFAEGHLRYHLSTLLTSKIPLLRKIKIQEHLGISAYTTSDRGQYAEAQAGLQWGPVMLMYGRRLTAPAHLLTPKHGIRVGLRF